MNFNTVITTLRSLATQQDQLAVTQGTLGTNLIAVYRSLGGGWQIRQMQDTLDLIQENTREEMLERTNYWNKSFEEKEYIESSQLSSRLRPSRRRYHV